MFVNKPIRLGILCSALLGGAALTGCVVASPVKNNLDNGVKIVQESSFSVSIYQSKLQQTAEGWTVQGRLTRKRITPGDFGHLDIVVANKQGNVLERQKFELEDMTDDIYSPTSGRFSSFQLTLNQTPEEIAEIRIRHHANPTNET